MAAAPRTVLIVGSVNMDLVVRAPHIPRPGETILGRDFNMIPGGKGANQAVAAARLGAAARMIGRVGDDELGSRLLEGLRADGVECSGVTVTPGIASGVAIIVVGEDGENAITVASGANFRVTPEDVTAREDLIRAADVCLLQLELPMETVVETLRLCRRHNVLAILDPAPVPAGPLPSGLTEAAVVSPNETEAAQLTGLPARTPPKRVAEALLAQGYRCVVLKLGARGAYYHSAEAQGLAPGFSISAVDTTAAGDAFTAALGVALAEGCPLPEAVRFANAAGALACTRPGAQPAMPQREEVEALQSRA